MSDTDKNISASNGEAPEKERVERRFIKSFLGAMALFATGTMITVLLKKDKLGTMTLFAPTDTTIMPVKKGEPGFTKGEVLSMLGLDVIGATLFGIYDSHKTTTCNKRIDELTKYNKRIDELTKQKADSHVQRYEQEKLASSQVPQIQGRM